MECESVRILIEISKLAAMSYLLKQYSGIFGFRLRVENISLMMQQTNISFVEVQRITCYFKLYFD